MENLNDSQLIKQYKLAKRNFILASEGSQDEIKSEEKYNQLWNEIQNRNLDLRKYY